MQRRHFLSGSAASLALPAIARAQGSRVLKFVPQSDVTILDPIWTTAYVTRNHGFMIFDTLYGIDSTYSRRRRWSKAIPSKTTASCGSSSCATI